MRIKDLPNSKIIIIVDFCKLVMTGDDILEYMICSVVDGV